MISTEFAHHTITQATLSFIHLYRTLKLIQSARRQVGIFYPSPSTRGRVVRPMRFEKKSDTEPTGMCA